MSDDEANDDERDEREGVTPAPAELAPGERARRAVTFYLQGRRVAEVAAELAVSETTVRRWTRQALATLAADERAERASQVQRAIESQRAVASAAWEAYERERELDEALLRGELDHVRRRAIRGPRRTDASASGEESPCPPLAMEEYERPKRTAQGARYLAVALAAQREVARLQGLYARLEEADRAVHITISRRPDGPENRAPASDDAADTEEGAHDDERND
jgi:hypothetical protein